MWTKNPLANRKSNQLQKHTLKKEFLKDVYISIESILKSKTKMNKIIQETALPQVEGAKGCD